MRTSPSSLTLDTVPLSGPSCQPGHLRLVCLSDTHGKHRDIQPPPGDILIHSGDFTNTGRLNEVEDFDNWLGTLPHPHKVVVPGNHDSIMDPVVRKMVKSAQLEVYDMEEVNKWEALENDQLLKNGHVLINRSVTIDGLKFFGSPHTVYNGQLARWVHNRYGYSFGETDESCIAQAVFQPESRDSDILVTHSPPLGIADISHHSHRGSLAVRDAVLKINPALHVFGHVHPYGGNVFKLQDNPKNRETISSAGYSGWWWAGLKTTFVNAASLTLPGLSEFKTRPLPADKLRRPVVIDIHRITKQVVC